LRIPRDWRPLRIEGTAEDGTMVLGNSMEVLARLRWHRGEPERPGGMLGAPLHALGELIAGRKGGRGFDAARWIARHVRHVAPGAAPDAHPPRPRGFDMAVWLPGLEAGTGAGAGAGGTRSIWYGWSSSARMLFEAVLRDATGGSDGRVLAQSVLPSLTASDGADRTRWAVFDVSFESPAGFELVAHRLQVGDMGLRLTAKDGRRLVVRQVYPASLALTRRDLAGWLAHGPFEEKHRTLRHGVTLRSRASSASSTSSASSASSVSGVSGESIASSTSNAAGAGPKCNGVEDCRIATPHRTYEGVRRRGWKRLAWPLGGWRAWRNVAVALHDKELDRLLLVECDSPRAGAEEAVAEAVAGMNWARRENATAGAGEHETSEFTLQRALDATNATQGRF
jgi:hypothetical protein